MDKEYIESIIEFHNRKVNKYDRWDGLSVTTNKRRITLAISSVQSCCEHYGTILSEDDKSLYIGTELMSINFIDACSYDECEVLKKSRLESCDVDVLDCAFINLNTDKGKLQFAVYNNHNGYYGHDIKFIEEDISSITTELAILEG
mgnify:FL=1